jgi:3-phenylpropionate/trans-cinnamate dioxygenase ferredoxin component
MEYTRVASTNDVPAGKMIKVNVGGKVVLIANVNGEFYALNNKCPHLGGSLADGSLNGEVVTCPRHHTQFNVKTGAVVGKGQLMFRSVQPKNAETIQLRVEGSDIEVGVA